MGDTPERPLVLLAEPQAILALEIATELKAAGFDVAGPVASCADLRIWKTFAHPKAAILHLNLRDGSCLDDAAALARDGIPVAVFTNSDTVSADPRVGWFLGPVEPKRLVRYLRDRTAGR